MVLDFHFELFCQIMDHVYNIYNLKQILFFLIHPSIQQVDDPFAIFRILL